MKTLQTFKVKLMANDGFIDAMHDCKMHDIKIVALVRRTIIYYY